MPRDPYVADRRTQADIVDAFGRGANLDEGRAWLKQLFRRDDVRNERHLLANPTDPSQALMDAIAGTVETLIGAFNERPRRHHLAVAESLNPERRPRVPDTIYLAFKGSKGQLPVELGGKTIVRALDPARGVPRDYALDHEITVANARVDELMALSSIDDGTEILSAGLVKEGSIDDFTPFTSSNARARLGVRFDVESPILRAAVPGARVRMRFDDPHPNSDAFAARIAELHWDLHTEGGSARLTPILRSVGPARVEATIEVPALTKPKKGSQGPTEAQISWSFPSKPRHTFSTEFSYSSLSIVVDATALPGVQLAANGLPQDVSKAVLPFGPRPAPGSRCLVGSPVLGAPLELCQFNWSGPGLDGSVPVSPILAHGHTASARSPRLTWERMEGGRWVPLTGMAHSLPDQPGSRPRFESVEWFRAGARVRGVTESSRCAAVTTPWIRLVLRDGDFGVSEHAARVQRYARAAAEAALNPKGFLQLNWGKIQALLPGGKKKAAKAAANFTDFTPPPPPRIEKPRISFRTQIAASNHGNLRYRRAIGFESATDASPAASRMRPFPGRSRGTGELLLGLTAELKGTRSLSLFIEIRPLATPGRVPARLFATCLIGDRWHPVEIDDHTRGLSRSGVIRFRPPADWSPAPLPLQTAHPPARLWLRLRVDGPRPSVQITQVLCNAGTATCTPPAQDSTDTPPLLPEKSTVSLLEPTAGIKPTMARQATRGQVAEDEDRYLERMGWLVQHRDRGLSCRDVERLVRAFFTQLTLVRCLPATSRSLGRVQVLIVPDSDDRLPAATVELSESVARFLQNFSALSATTVLTVPQFIPVRATVTVKSAHGWPPEDTRDLVHAELSRLIHPRNHAGGLVEFDYTLTPSHLEKILLTLPAVHEVRKLELHAPGQTQSSVSTRRPDELLVSAQTHKVELVT